MWALVKALIAFCIEFLCLFLIEHPETEWLEEVKNWIIGSKFHVSVHALFYYLKVH